tara:strand:- start:181 stop:297 length:117 start_codon:yes stop_codon:yes gene_type:complete
MESFLGTIWWSVLVFTAGALIGVPAWNWVRGFFPWNNK